MRIKVKRKTLLTPVGNRIWKPLKVFMWLVFITVGIYVQAVATLAFSVVMGWLLLIVVALITILLIAGYKRLKSHLQGEPDNEEILLEKPEIVRIYSSQTVQIDLVNEDESTIAGHVVLAERWVDIVHDTHFPLYRLHTKPKVAGIHGQLTSGFYQNWEHGLLLQLLELNTDATQEQATSWLVYLDDHSLEWHRIEEVGLHILYHPEKDAHGICFWDDKAKQEVELCLSIENS